MPGSDPYGFHNECVQIEPEVATNSVERFAAQYLNASGVSVKPGHPPEFMEQANKHGIELRVCFNSSVVADRLGELGYAVEDGLSDHSLYRFRANGGKLVWHLIEKYVYRLGRNRGAHRT
jgi:hypothetical protein